MFHLRETVRRILPTSALEALVDLKDRLATAPGEDLVQHDYQLAADPSPRPRLTLVIPTVAPAKAFGGVMTGIEIFLECGKRVGADLRILIDDFEDALDRALVDGMARSIGLDPRAIEIVPRVLQTPIVAVRSNDIFVAFNWWVAVNIRSLMKQQEDHYSNTPKPLLYLIQEYEPGFYPFSPAHMFARSAFDSPGRLWGIFNSRQLRDYFLAQGHRVEREYTFEPRLSRRLAPFLKSELPAKEKRILVYGRPRIARNCFPSILKGLGAWADRHPEFADWQIVSAGQRHRPIHVAKDRPLKSLGKLSLEDYATVLQTSAVGLSLMVSPHPSYPPLEMAHFGLRTVTNAYANKDLSLDHENIISIPDIGPATIAAALATACREFEAAPDSGWKRKSNMPDYLTEEPMAFLNDLARDLSANVWY